MTEFCASRSLVLVEWVLIGSIFGQRIINAHSQAKPAKLHPVMNRFFLPVLAVASLLVAPVSLLADIPARGIGSYHDERTGLTVVVAEAELEGDWGWVPPEAGSPIVQVFALPLMIDLFAAPKPAAKQTVTLVALLRDPKAAEATLALRRKTTEGEKTEILRWPLQDSLAAKSETEQRRKDWFVAWAEMRREHWEVLTAPSMTNPLVELWEAKGKEIYGLPEFGREQRWARARRERDERTADLGSLSVFGGQAAIRETLQTQLLARGEKGAEEKRTELVADIQGVEVKAHPYAEMAAQLPAAQPSLADYVPEDRLLILLREPREVARLLNGADDTAGRLAPLLGESFSDYGLLRRYTARFGLTPEQARQWFSGGNVEEVAVSAPDVFFRDSTDLTLVIRLKPNAKTPFALVKNLSSVVSFPLPNGETFHLASKDDLLFLSTSKAELERSLALAEEKGRGSLGRTDEFRVMTRQLPIGEATRVFVYFSDPFIRRLTGPEVKIGQLRRSLARGKMEYLTLLSLLYRLDQGAEAQSWADLQAKGYLGAEEIDAEEFSLLPSCRVASREWGTLARLKTLGERPVTQVTPFERKSYENYRDAYTAFWRQYFDPIAVRLDFGAEGKIALETFILPLIDNSLYGEIKTTLGTEKPGPTKLPIYAEPAVATLAFNVPQTGWVHGFMRTTDREFHARFFELFPLLGDNVVLSIRDAAPVVQVNLPGVSSFGERGALSGMSGAEMVWVPVVASLFTRPCDLAIPVRDTAATLNALRRLGSVSRSWIQEETVFFEEEKMLVLSWSLEGIVQLEVGFTVENGWLHITNHPWTPVPITGTETAAPAHAMVELEPSALRAGLPQTLALAQSAYRKSVYAAAAQLLPWMAAFDETQENALERQFAALGQATPVPAEVKLSAEEIAAPPYRNWRLQQMPGFAKDDHGVLRGIEDIRLWLRFEDEGLRTRVEFSPVEGK